VNSDCVSKTKARTYPAIRVQIPARSELSTGPSKQGFAKIRRKTEDPYCGCLAPAYKAIHSERRATSSPSIQYLVPGRGAPAAGVRGRGRRRESSLTRVPHSRSSSPRVRGCLCRPSCKPSPRIPSRPRSSHSLLSLLSLLLLYSHGLQRSRQRASGSACSRLSGPGRSAAPAALTVAKSCVRRGARAPPRMASQGRPTDMRGWLPVRYGGEMHARHGRLT
jgi:hypothetical protein